MKGHYLKGGWRKRGPGDRVVEGKLALSGIENAKEEAVSRWREYQLCLILQMSRKEGLK